MLMSLLSNKPINNKSRLPDLEIGEQRQEEQGRTNNATNSQYSLNKSKTVFLTIVIAAAIVSTATIPFSLLHPAALSHGSREGNHDANNFHVAEKARIRPHLDLEPLKAIILMLLIMIRMLHCKHSENMCSKDTQAVRI